MSISLGDDKKGIGLGLCNGFVVWWFGVGSWFSRVRF